MSLRLVHLATMHLAVLSVVRVLDVKSVLKDLFICLFSIETLAYSILSKLSFFRVNACADYLSLSYLRNLKSLEYFLKFLESGSAVEENF